MLLKKLTESYGLPGFEDEVRSIIIEELKGHIDSYIIDRMGNLIVTKNKNYKEKHIALSAHMDEVGFFVKGITKKGAIKFVPWGVDVRLLPSMHVVIGKNKIRGVMGTRPIHLQTEENRAKTVKLKDISIDIGVTSKEEAEKLVNVGDFIGFVSDYVEFGEGKIKAKSLDDRAGCACLIEVLKSNIKERVTGIFVVQEEIGLRGSSAAAYTLLMGDKPSVLINLEATIGADVSGIDKQLHATTQGAGPAISIMDRTSIYRRAYIDEVVRVAEKKNIPYQFRRSGMGGTDAGSYHSAADGIACVNIAVPCRYIHSPVSILTKSDYENYVKLVKEVIEEGNFDEIK